MNFYNEHDPRAAAWLRELIAASLIPPGVVDERSIVDLKPEDLYGFTQIHLFAGIGGWALALALADWPATRPVCTCSCPCQPFSGAGLGLGEVDERHLWPVAFNLIRACGFPVVIGEQVASKAVVGGSGTKAGGDAQGAAEFTWIDRVFADLEGASYACAAVDIPAAGIGEKVFTAQAEILRGAVACGDPQAIGREREVLAAAEFLDELICGAPHIRQRLFWMAVAGSQPARRQLQRPGESAGADAERASGQLGGPGDGSRRLGIANGPGWDARQFASEAAGYGRAALAAGDPLGLADTRRGSSAWSDFSIIPCRDGKARRIPRIAQPDVQLVADGLSDLLADGWSEGDAKAILEAAKGFPLAKGVKGRTGLLRGAGNAIVPQAAAEFIGAVMEIL